MFTCNRILLVSSAVGTATTQFQDNSNLPSPQTFSTQDNSKHFGGEVGWEVNVWELCKWELSTWELSIGQLSGEKGTCLGRSLVMLQPWSYTHSGNVGTNLYMPVCHLLVTTTDTHLKFISWEQWKTCISLLSRGNFEAASVDLAILIIRDHVYFYFYYCSFQGVIVFHNVTYLRIFQNHENMVIFSMNFLSNAFLIVVIFVSFSCYHACQFNNYVRQILSLM